MDTVDIPIYWQILGTLWLLIQALLLLAVLVVTFLAQNALAVIWIAWWLFAVNWKKAGPVLAWGSWVPLLLLVILSALVWSKLFPGETYLVGGFYLPNFWSQLFQVGLLIGIAFFCGWLQGILKVAPVEISLDPPAPSGHHGH